MSINAAAKTAKPMNTVNRRQLLGVGAVALAAVNAKAFAAPGGAGDDLINHSVVPWCFKESHTVEQLATFGASIGLKSVELCDDKYWPYLKELGMTCAIASGAHGFKDGPNHRGNWDMVIRKLKERIDVAAAHDVKRLITFVGMEDGPDGRVDLETGGKNAVECWKKVIGHAESKGVTLCCEMLNTRDDSHPMKGHPGHQGNHIDWVVDVVKQVGSANMKVLFDIYHVQIMDGDVIRRIKQHAEYIGHIHTAGNPGRGELDSSQEINYPAVMQALVSIGYDGFVGHEFIPTGDPEAGLRQAVDVCRVTGKAGS